MLGCTLHFCLPSKNVVANHFAPGYPRLPDQGFTPGTVISSYGPHTRFDISFITFTRTFWDYFFVKAVAHWRPPHHARNALSEKSSLKMCVWKWEKKCHKWGKIHINIACCQSRVNPWSGNLGNFGRQQAFMRGKKYPVRICNYKDLKMHAACIANRKDFV